MAKITRREAIAAGVAVGALGTQQPLRATPEVKETHRQGEGPYYKPGAPVRSNLREPGIEGTPLVVTGRILSTSGAPLEKALFDVWHANTEGVYDNDGFKLRGRLYTDAKGSFKLETIMPRHYSSRTAHIHCKVSADGHREITTQLYFKGYEGNSRDRSAIPELMIEMKDAADGKSGTFDFVLSRTA